MDRKEAVAVLADRLAEWRLHPYATLVAQIGASPVVLQVTRNHTTYQLEIECLWDGRPGGNVRVVGSIDDGGWHAFVPASLGFIKSPDGRIVGE